MLTIHDLRSFAKDAQGQICRLGNRGSSCLEPRTTYIDRSWTTWSTHHHYPSNESGPSNKKVKDRTGSIALGLLFVMLGSAGLGSAYGSLKGRIATLNATNEIAYAIQKEGYPSEISPLAKQSFQKLLDAKFDSDLHRVDAIKIPAVLSLGFALGGASLGIGGYQNLPNLVTAGNVALVMSSILGLGYLGFQYSNESSNSQSRRIEVLSQYFLQETETTLIGQLFKAIQLLFSSCFDATKGIAVYQNHAAFEESTS